LAYVVIIWRVICQSIHYSIRKTYIINYPRLYFLGGDRLKASIKVLEL
jgi:hypothetical protein